MAKSRYQSEAARAEFLEKQLEERNKEFEQFIHAAAHDLQEPLRTVTMYADLLLARSKDKLSEEEKEFLEYTIAGAQRSQEILRALLEYAKVSGRANDLKAADMKTAAEKAQANLRLVIEQTKAEVKSEPLPRVTADFAQMVLLFQSLLSNAVKFKSDKPPRIFISAQENESEWLFAVGDNGIGIAAEFHGRIFDLFQRLHRNKYPGTGIGLALCRKIVQRHGGRIWVESEPGKGSTFYFTIPK